MPGADEYNKDFEQLMQATEEKARYAATLNNKEFLARAKSVRLGPTKMLKILESGGMEGLVREVFRRERRRVHA